MFKPIGVFKLSNDTVSDDVPLKLKPAVRKMPKIPPKRTDSDKIQKPRLRTKM